jgi:hypothetical protein
VRDLVADRWIFTAPRSSEIPELPDHGGIAEVVHRRILRLKATAPDRTGVPMGSLACRRTRQIPENAVVVQQDGFRNSRSRIQIIPLRLSSP